MAVIESVLARNYVEFVARGVNSVNLAVDRVRTGLEKAVVVARAMKERLELVAQPAARLAALGAAFIGIFSRAALKDTVEGERLAQTFERLSQVVGAIFLPYVQALTDRLQRLTAWFENLDQGTKDAIARFVVIGTAVTTAAASLTLLTTAFAGVVTVLKGLTTVVGLFLSPWLLIPAAIIAAVGALLYFTAEGETMEQKITSVIGNVIKGFLYLKAGAHSALAFAGAVVNDFVEIMRVDFTNAYRRLIWFADNWKAIFADLFQNTLTFLKNLGGALSKFFSAGGPLTAIIEGRSFDFNFGEEFGKKLFEGMQRTTSPLPELLRYNLQNPITAAAMAWEEGTREIDAYSKAMARGLVDRANQIGDQFRQALTLGPGGEFTPKLKLKVDFESLQGTFDRLQKALGGSEDVEKQQLEQLKKIVNEGVKIKNMPPVVR